MSTPLKVTTRRLRQLQKEADKLVDAKEKAEEDILVFICETKAEGATNAAIGGMFHTHPTAIPAKVAKGAEILAERKGRRAG